MEIENLKDRSEHDLNFEEEARPPDQALNPLEIPTRSKSSLRMNYEAHAEVIRKQTGDLESIRKTLGLSQRKMAQLLLVDPSAWTRWMKDGNAPPHIYRALQWFMTLQEKIPGLTPGYFIGRDSRVDHEEIRTLEKQLSARIQELEDANLKLKTQVQGTRVGFFMLVVSILILAFMFFSLLKRV